MNVVSVNVESAASVHASRGLIIIIVCFFLLLLIITLLKYIKQQRKTMKDIRNRNNNYYNIRYNYYTAQDQGRTQEFFPGGARSLSTIFDGKSKRGRKAPLPHEGAFAFLRLKLNDLVHTLGGIFGKFSIKK